MRGIERFKMASLAFARKSQGRIEPRDVLYGTILRFDPQQRGRINEKGVREVCAELGKVMFLWLLFSYVVVLFLSVLNCCLHTGSFVK